MVEDENDRIAQRRVNFGEEGLQKKNDALKAAMTYNEVYTYPIFCLFNIF